MMLNSRAGCAVLWLAGTLMAFGGATQAAIVTIDAVADAQIRQHEPDFAAGELALLRVEGTVGKVHLALIRWDLSDISSNVVVNDVTLRAIQTNLDVGPGLLVHSIDAGTWDERGVTWNQWVSQTTELTYLGVMLVNGFETNGGLSTFNDPDLTALVQRWVDRRQENLGLLLSFNGTSTGDSLASREYDSLDPPQLTVEYTAVPEPSTAILLGLGSLALAWGALFTREFARDDGTGLLGYLGSAF